MSQSKRKFEASNKTTLAGNLYGIFPELIIKGERRRVKPYRGWL